MKYARIILVLLATASVARAQHTARYLQYEWLDGNDINWRIVASGDSLGTGTYELFGHKVSEDGWAYHAVCAFSAIGRGNAWLLSGGSCTRIDTDGDLLHIVWEMQAPGDAAAGVWHSSGGTGKYADLVCQGSWRGVAAFQTTDPDWGKGGERGMTAVEETCRKR